VRWFLFLVLFAAAPLQAADSFPNKPIRVLVPFAPGGMVDVATRTLTSKIAEIRGWQFVVDNRPGANGFIAVGIAAKAVPDGYTLLSAHTGEFSVNPVLFKDVPYNLDRDFTPIIMLSNAPLLVVVNVASPLNSIKDLIAAMRAKPGTVTFGSPGSGSVNHMAQEWLVAVAGAKAVHVPYKGGAAAVLAVAGNEVVFTAAGLPGVLPHLEAKRVRVLGVTTAKRSPQLPDYPSLQEAGLPGIDASIWVGLFAPRGTPKGVVSRLYGASVEALQMPDLRQRFVSVVGAEPSTLGTEAFTKKIREELERYRKIAGQIGIQPQ
jgi:tripartite-type tricarboxylate transporter receptor subunit TctC